MATFARAAAVAALVFAYSAALADESNARLEEQALVAKHRVRPTETASRADIAAPAVPSRAVTSGGRAQPRVSGALRRLDPSIIVHR